MAPFRSLLSFWNELGLVLSLLLCIGYFGTRSALAFVPIALLTVFVAGGVGGCVWIAIQQSQAEDSCSEARPWGDRALWYAVSFLIGALAVTALGSSL